MNNELITAIISPIASITVSGILFGWGYKILNHSLQFQEKKYEELKNDMIQQRTEFHREIEKIKQIKDKWFNRYHGLVDIILTNRDDESGNPTKIYREFIKMTKDEGAI